METGTHFMYRLLTAPWQSLSIFAVSYSLESISLSNRNTVARLQTEAYRIILH